MAFSRVNPLGWALFEELTSAQMNQLDINASRAIDGHEGGTYTPSNPIIINGAGIEINIVAGDPTFTGEVTFTDRVNFQDAFFAAYFEGDVWFTGANTTTVGIDQTWSFNGVMDLSPGSGLAEIIFGDNSQLTITKDGLMEIEGDFADRGTVRFLDDSTLEMQTGALFQIDCNGSFGAAVTFDSGSFVSLEGSTQVLGNFSVPSTGDIGIHGSAFTITPHPTSNIAWTWQSEQNPNIEFPLQPANERQVTSWACVYAGDGAYIWRQTSEGTSAIHTPVFVFSPCKAESLSVIRYVRVRAKGQGLTSFPSVGYVRWRLELFSYGQYVSGWEADDNVLATLNNWHTVTFNFSATPITVDPETDFLLLKCEGYGTGGDTLSTSVWYGTNSVNVEYVETTFKRW